MPRTIRWAILATLLLLSPLYAQPADPLVSAELLSDASTIQPGQTFRIGVLFAIKPGWHIYWQNPGDAGMPTAIRITAPRGFTVGEWQYPVPIRFEQPGEIAGYGYTDQVLLIAAVKAPADLRTETSVPFEARASWLVCNDVCVPGKASLKLVLTTADAGTPARTELFDTWQARMPAPQDAPQGPLKSASTSGTLPASGPAAFEITLAWNKAPADIEWFPQTPAALAIEDITVKTQADQTRLTFKARVLPGQTLQAATLPSVVAYTDTQGQRRGISLPVHLRAAASQP